jgi:hypothetical protein
LLALDPAWVQNLPNHKLPDRTDFTRSAQDLPARLAGSQGVTAASEQLAQEFAQWLHKPDVALVEPLSLTLEVRGSDRLFSRPYQRCAHRYWQTIKYNKILIYSIY